MSILGRILRSYVNQRLGIRPDKKKKGGGSILLTVSKDSSLRGETVHKPQAAGFLSLKTQVPGKMPCMKGNGSLTRKYVGHYANTSAPR